MRLIDADALMDALPIVTEDKKITLYGAVADFMIMISTMPTIQAEPVKHGKWLPQTVLGSRVWDCSECATLGSPHWKRCPVCEAKMDGERKET